jgi:hypothetical protein
VSASPTSYLFVSATRPDRVVKAVGMDVDVVIIVTQRVLLSLLDEREQESESAELGVCEDAVLATV